MMGLALEYVERVYIMERHGVASGKGGDYVRT